MDLYERLGVEPTASSDEIKAAYRAVAKECHPDKDPSPEAEARFKDASEAYEVLMDGKARAEYDTTGEFGKVRASSMAMVQAIVEQIVQTMLADPFLDIDPKRVDTQIRSALREHVRVSKNSVMEAKALLIRARKVAKAATYKGSGVDFFKMSLDRAIAAASTALKQAEVNLATAEKAVEIIKDYSFNYQQDEKLFALGDLSRGAYRGAFKI